MLNQWGRENELRGVLFNLNSLALSDYAIKITSAIVICTMQALIRYKLY